MVNSFVRTMAVPGLAAVWMSRRSPSGPAMTAAFTCPPLSAARAAPAVGSMTSRTVPAPWPPTTSATGERPATATGAWCSTG